MTVKSIPPLAFRITNVDRAIPKKAGEVSVHIRMAPVWNISPTADAYDTERNPAGSFTVTVTNPFFPIPDVGDYYELNFVWLDPLEAFEDGEDGTVSPEDAGQEEEDEEE